MLILAFKEVLHMLKLCTNVLEWNLNWLAKVLTDILLVKGC